MTTIVELGQLTTGIGSLPHHNIDAALAFSFQMGMPFLPQIPMRNPWEFMIAQALEGMPGLEVEPEGSAVLDLSVWTARSRALSERLFTAFSQTSSPDAFQSFEPSSATSSSWQPFLFELQEKGSRVAKIQLAGPLTAQWVLKIKDGSPADTHPEVATQIYRLVLARAIAMSRRLQAEKIQPVLFLDEPGLYTLSVTNPRHLLGLQELKLLIQALKKEGVQVGMHCCSNTDWNVVLGLGLNLISIDTQLSLGPLLAHASALEAFILNGGRLSLGVIPTSREPAELRSLEPGELHSSLLDAFEQVWNPKPDLVRKVLSEAVYTPACGLALHSVADAEIILDSLLEFQRFLSRALKTH